jgi:pimeloyl-ACP methyl ester carboxylesterase
MTSRINLWKAIGVFVLIGCGGVFGQAPAQQPSNPAVAALGQGFVSTTAKVNGTTLRYVRGGTGSAVILLHGFPQDWYEFHQIMPRLAKKFTVIAVDLRGIGGSAATPGGYEAGNLAEDIHQLARQLKLERVYVAGHDIGGMVAYAFVRRYPEATRGVMIPDVPLPGIEPWEAVKADPRLWHMGFHQTPEIPEKLIAGRQFLYFREHFFSFGGRRNPSISDADVTHYANSYAAPEQLRAGMEYYRAFPANEQFNAAQRDKSAAPFVLVGGEHSFASLLPKMATDLRAHGCENVSVEIIKGGAHYLLDEKPEAVAELIERYASSAAGDRPF